MNNTSLRIKEYFAPKVVFLKRAIPTYIMSCFKIPQTICEQIESLISKFWWGQREEKKGIHWLAWDKLCVSKHGGGLGFRKFSCFNQALLAKQSRAGD